MTVESCLSTLLFCCFFVFFQAEDGIRDIGVTGVQTCALPILLFEEGQKCRDADPSIHIQPCYWSGDHYISRQIPAPVFSPPRGLGNHRGDFSARDPAEYQTESL